MTKNALFLKRLSLSFTAILCATSFPVFAQEAKTDRDIVSGETRAEQELAELALKARTQKKLQGLKDISFEQILADPDNIELNMRYAEEQVKNNDLLGAAATLERILLIDPDLPEVRLFYAVVLFRLDNLEESQRELEKLMKYEMPDKLRDELDLYVHQIKLRRRNTKFSIRQSSGWGIDSNRNAAPSSKRRLFLDTPFGLTGTTRKTRDTHFLNITSVDVRHDMGFQAGHELIGSFTYFLQEQAYVDSLDLSSYQYELGTALKSNRFFNFKPTFYASHIYLSRENFLRAQGLNFDFDRKLGRKFNWFYNVRWERQDFLDISENAAAPERDGQQIDTSMGLSYAITPYMSWSNSILYANKHAEEKYNSFERLVLQTSHTWLIGKGLFAINSFELGKDFYDEVDNSIAGRMRKDKILRYRVTVGAPLTTLLIGKVLPRFFKDMTFSFSYEYFRSLSNITNYTYHNNKGQLLLSKTIEF